MSAKAPFTAATRPGLSRLKPMLSGCGLFGTCPRMRSPGGLPQGKRMKVCNPIAEAFRGGHRCGNPTEPSNRRGLMAECRPILGIDRLHAFALRPSRSPPRSNKSRVRSCTPVTTSGPEGLGRVGRMLHHKHLGMVRAGRADLLQHGLEVLGAGGASGLLKGAELQHRRGVRA